MSRITNKFVSMIKHYLDIFYFLSGQIINRAKSKIIISKHYPKSISNNISNLLNINISYTFEKYLGFPITNSITKASDFQYVIDKMLSRLASWKTSCLSMVGRCTLATSCLNSLPTHIMQYTLLPSKTLKNIDKIQRNFLWGTNTTSKKLHLIK